MKKLIKSLTLVSIFAVLALAMTACDWDAIMNPYIPVTSVRITSQRSSFSYGSSLMLISEVLPAHATNKNVTYSIVQETTTAPDVQINGDTLTAGGVGVVNLIATSQSGNIFSTVFRVDVTEIMATDIQNANNRDRTHTTTYFEPFNTNYMTNTGWRHSDNGVLYQVGQSGNTGNNRISLRSGGYMQLRNPLTVNTGDILTVSFFARAPHIGGTPVNIRYNFGNAWLNIGTAPSISYTVSSWSRVSREITFERSGRVSIGIFSGSWNELLIDDITIALTSRVPSFAAGQSITLTSNVSPSNATNKDVTYEIVAEDTTATGVSINGSVLRATGSGVIAIRPRTSSFVGPVFYVLVT
ncbi:MAG: Ig-like domain-containing protein [Firmicutes bacterium]|nr:Ig-like domain-containing protein [Bacillota bacterium]